MYIFVINSSKKQYMKKFASLLVFIVLYSLTSCTFTESVTINDAGSGKFSFYMDGSRYMEMMPADSTANDEEHKNIDSTFTFKELFKTKSDSIARLPKEEQERLKKLESYKIIMKVNYEEKKMLYSMLTDFKKTTELENPLQTFGTVQAIADIGAADFLGSIIESKAYNSDISYGYDGKKFTRKATENKIKKENIITIDQEAVDMLKTFLESSTYKIEYHFPKAVKKISNEKAVFSEDRKSITLEYPFYEYMDNPDLLNIEVLFDK
jgi:hypothetical protein